jgi:1-aminocyclopropane-1-carboxylate deaminase/D-cysteine desulfhydrase-like pyridoxal-dependent ACC family enzyme
MNENRKVVRPLFQAYPALMEKVPFVPLANLPTPLERMERLSAETGADLWVKRDGLTHPIYGGNKIRKFEFVFGDALRKGAKVVLTGGGLGSHHTLAAAVIARQLGLKPVCSYYCQPITDEVHRNLRLSVPLGIDAHYCGDYVGVVGSFLWQYARWLVRTRRVPYFIYPGASNTLGLLGYVNAAFELRAQLATGGIQEPDAIFVAVGSCGTFAGLLLGAQLAGLRSPIVGVRIIEEDQANRTKVARLANRTARALHRLDPSIPLAWIEPSRFELLDGYVGPAYGFPTPEALRAVERAAMTEGLLLETTYTGKALAALLDHADSHRGSRLLFVDTFAEEPALQEGDPHDLPRAFWQVFDSARRARCWCLRAMRDPGFCWKERQIGG